MKVILLRDVAKIGRRNTVVEVPDGYALNRLIPRQEAVVATASNLKSLNQKLDQTNSHNEATLREVAELAKRLEEAKITVSLKANDQGHLYEALSPALVVRAAGEAGISIEKSMVVVPTAHKELGECAVALRALGQSFSFKIKLVAN